MSRWLRAWRAAPLRQDRSLTLLVCDGVTASWVQPLLASLEQRFPRMKTQVVDVPPPAPLIRRYLKRSQTGIVIYAGLPGPAATRFLAQAWRRGCAMIAALSASESARTDAVQALRQRGWIEYRIVPEDDFATTLAAITPLLARSLRPVAQQRRQQSGAGETSLRGALLQRWKWPAVESLQQLHDALGAPQSILCLGNGPSGLAPELQSLRCDTLFRVNISWRGQGPHQAPDLVFSNLNAALQQLRPRVGFVVRKRSDAEHMRRQFRRSPRRIRLMSGESLGVIASDDASGFLPTNGAVMLATAVALKPRRLVVAGIDLFSDPAGAYPGDTRTPNDYALGHDRDAERDYIVGLLRAFDGELVVYGAALKAALITPLPAGEGNSAISSATR